MPNTHRYPRARLANVPIAISEAAGPDPLFSPLDWTELTDTGMGSLTDPNGRVDSLTYDSGTGWTVDWAAGGSANHSQFSNMAHRQLKLTTIESGFDWDTTCVELFILAEDVAGLNPTSPYRTGFAIGIAVDTGGGVLGDGFGPGIVSQGATTTGVGVVRDGANYSSISSGFDFFGHYHEVRQDAGGGLSSRLHRYRESGNTPLTGGTSLTNDTTIVSTAVGSLVLGIFCIVNTASAVADHTQVARAYYRFTPMPRIPTEAQIEAL